MDDNEQVEQTSPDEAAGTHADETTASQEAEARAAGEKERDAVSALKGLGAALGGALRAAASTPEAEQLKEKARATAASVSEDIGSKASEVEGTDAGQKLKAGTASLLGATSSALNKAAANLEVPEAETTAGEQGDAAAAEGDANETASEDGAASEDPSA